MRSILTAIEIEEPEPRCIELGIYLAQLTGSPLTAVFIDTINTPEPVHMTLPYRDADVNATGTSNQPAVISKSQQFEKGVQLFESTCSRRVAHHVLLQSPATLDGLIAETQYADMLVAPLTFYSTAVIRRSSLCSDHLLRQTACPVIFSSSGFKEIQELYFASDNQTSCFFAIKQFTYLFPELRDKKLTVLRFNDETVPENTNYESMVRYLEPHYREITFHKTDNEIFDYLIPNENAFMIADMCLYSRLLFFFKCSPIDAMLKVNTMPLFITQLP